MNETSETNAVNYLVVALAGVVVGAAVSLLLAPGSGRETRRWLADETRKVKDNSAALLHQGMQAMHLESRDGENRPSITGSGA